jgi:hypothetical protein
MLQPLERRLTRGAESRVKTILTAERLKEVVTYDPDTGAFMWKHNKKGGVRAGDLAGYTDTTGYIQIRIDMRLYKAHRLAWLYVHGEWPSLHIDHINGNPHDNRIENLRLADDHQNCANSKISKNNKSGLKGVSWSKAKRRWTAHICVRRKRMWLGYFDDADGAKRAYDAAAKKHFGDFARAA